MRPSERDPRGPSLALGLALVAACSGDKGGGDQVTTEDDGGGVVAGDGGGDSCGPSAPTLTDGPWCRYEGLAAPEENLDEVPVLRIGVDAADEDGDLHYRATRLWWDQEPWGEIDTATAASKERSLTRYSDDACEEFEALDVGDKIYIQPNQWEYGVDHDFGIQVADADGHWSEVAVVTCPTPLKDGSEP